MRHKTKGSSHRAAIAAIAVSSCDGWYCKLGARVSEEATCRDRSQLCGRQLEFHDICTALTSTDVVNVEGVSGFRACGWRSDDRDGARGDGMAFEV